MNNYVKSFFHRGLIFGGFGPIVTATVIFTISCFDEEILLNAKDLLIAIVSSYLLAFVQAGASVFNQIEHWSVPKSLFCHFTSLYLTYSLCYIANSWIPFVPQVIGIFTAIFVAVYFAVWITVYLCVRSTSKKLNERL